MRERGYGPGELAYQSGLSYNYVYKIRKGGAPNIAAAQVQKLARALRTTPDYLLGLTNDVHPPDEPGEPYEIIGGRAELAPEVADLAQRIDELPDGLRARMVGLVDQALELVAEELAVANLSERGRELVEMFETLDPEDQATLEQTAEAMRAARRAAFGAPGDARRAS